jgi:hypothetical protein
MTLVRGSVIFYFVATVAAMASVPPPTFNKDIAPVIFQNCADCHRPGEVAPFSLLDYQDVKKHAATIVKVTQRHVMPPWKAEKGFGEFHDARFLSEEQIALFKNWKEAGMPEGNAVDLPAPPKFTEGWMLGKPDLVCKPAESYTLEAEGRDVYRCFVIPSQYAEDRYVAAVEVRPGNRAIVHHVIAYLDTSGKARELDAADSGPGYGTFGGVGFLPSGSLGGWAPGNFPRLLPDSIGVLLPKGADIVLQVHYHKTGKVETDQTRIGLYFCRGPVDKRQRVFPLSSRNLNIPPGDTNFTVRASLPILFDVSVHAIMPHMHLIGKEMAVVATLPDGSTRPLIKIPDWDFNWQNTYRFKEPVPLPRGSRVDLVARYDNSSDNARNPSHPPQWVRRGEETTNEMCIAFLYYTVEIEHLTQGKTVTGFPDTFGGGRRQESKQ